MPNYGVWNSYTMHTFPVFFVFVFAGVGRVSEHETIPKPSSNYRLIVQLPVL